ncbi:MAG: alanine--tRNA ligase-related protein, partial [Polyangiales bacterium]
MRTDQADAYRTSLDARVRTVVRAESGVWASLTDSVFYPTSGGQPHDTGTLAHDGGVARVVDVTLDASGAVLHRIEGELPAEGDVVHAEIDWDRRYRHMQRHSAQHLLSQAFLQVAPRYATRSVSLASADATLDLDGDPDDAAVEAAFERARAWAYQALPIESFEVDGEELSRYRLRRPPKVSGTVR